MINNVHLFYSLASSRPLLNPSFIHLPRAKRNQQAREDLLERTFSKSSCLTSEETNSDGAQPRYLYFLWIEEGEHFMTPGTILVHPNKLAYPCAKVFLWNFSHLFCSPTSKKANREDNRNSGCAPSGKNIESGICALLEVKWCFLFHLAYDAGSLLLQLFY